MFEKEAKKYADNNFCGQEAQAIAKAAFKYGAEFGYNRVNEWHIELEKENRVLKCFIKDLIYENRNTCFQFSNTTCLFNSDYRNRAEELIGEKL